MIDLRSDTCSQPTEAMREAMARAAVGDDVYGDDPTVKELEAEVAAILGVEDAVYLPTGTMSNQIAVRTHCTAGDEVIAHETAHIIQNEGGGVGALTGALVLGVRGDRGQFDADTVRQSLRERRRNIPTQRLVAVEQTANSGGGTVWPLAKLNGVLETAHEHGLATHMDGARLMNAVIASGVSARDMVAHCDSVWVDFTKGLGAPLGAVLCGSDEFIDTAWRWKQRLGGSLRQAGVCAAACIYALDHNIERLADDHANARALAQGLAQIPGITVETPETNLVFFDTTGTGLSADQLAQRVRREGITLSTAGHYRARACTHLDIDHTGVELALQAIRHALAD